MPLSRIDLDECSNTGCKTRCNKEKRIDTTENDLCKDALSLKDGLPIRCVGEWAIEKIYLLNQYFGIFAPGMKNKWELNYIEICSGPGRCISRETGTEFNGSSLTILKHQAFQYIHSALFFDSNSKVVETLNSRIKAISANNAMALLGNYNNPTVICRKITNEINAKSLNIIFIDPTDCSVPFNLIKSLKATIPNIDFIINIATGTDFNRNIKEALQFQDKYTTSISKYSKFLGTVHFFQNRGNINLAEQGNNLGLRMAFRNAYEENMRSIGYNHFSFNSIRNYYDILFTTTHKKGIEFWDEACKYKYDGQKRLF